MFEIKGYSELGSQVDALAEAATSASIKPD
jgi:hypothetical protein